MVLIKAQRTPVACLALSVLLVACSHPPKTSAQPAPEAESTAAAVPDRYADDVARFLAGLPGNPGSPFAALESQPAWIEHRQDSDRAWQRIEESSLPAMRAFQKQELSIALVAKAPVFYPFRGPDALMITLFFPQSPRWINSRDPESWPHGSYQMNYAKNCDDTQDCRSVIDSNPKNHALHGS